VLLVLVVVVLATTPWGNERVRRIVVSRLNDRLTGTLHVERLRGNLFAGATLSGVAIVDSAKQPVFSATRVKVDYALLPLLRRQVVIERLVLDTVAMVFDKRPGQRWNFQALMRPSGATKDTSQHGTPPRLGEVVIHDGRFSWRRPWRPDSNLPADRRDAAIAAALGAEELLLVSDVAGVLLDERPIASLSPDDAQRLIDDGTARGGMAAKLQAALAALEGGVQRVRISDVAAISDTGRGTVLTRVGSMCA
jgi:hypothetical protein